MDSQFAPVCLFVFNRPSHTRQTVEHLVANTLAKDTDLIIFADGAKLSASQQALEAIEQVRAYVKSITGFRSLKVIERDKNLGLASSIIQGVTNVVNEYGKVIVVEDDLITSRYFLKFMNDGLNVYAAEKNVASIHGYVYPVDSKLPDTFFIKGADCWGWATWQDRWKAFNPDGKMLINELASQKKFSEFDFDGSYPYLKMLENQIAGKNSSWAIRWYATAFLKNWYTLYPGKSLVFNIGNDDTGTHSSASGDFDVDLYHSPLEINKLKVETNREGRAAFISYFRKIKRSFFRRVLNKVARILGLK
jgi:hypothetical protein